jgi:DNA-binding NarL/FixJ family response regulator
MPDGLRVLLVDDTDLASLQTIVQGEGFDIVGAATSGEEALELAADRDIDVAVVDYRMPGIDGVETAARLKVMKPDVKVIILTSYDVRDVVDQSHYVDHDHEKIAVESLPEAIRRLIAPPPAERGRRRLGRRR